MTNVCECTTLVECLDMIRIFPGETTPRHILNYEFDSAQLARKSLVRSESHRCIVSRSCDPR